MENGNLSWERGVSQQPTNFLEKQRRLQFTRRSETVLLSVNSQGELPGNRGYDESVKIRTPEEVKKACLQYSTGHSFVVLVYGDLKNGTKPVWSPAWTIALSCSQATMLSDHRQKNDRIVNLLIWPNLQSALETPRSGWLPCDSTKYLVPVTAGVLPTGSRSYLYRSTGKSHPSSFPLVCVKGVNLNQDSFRVCATH
jgi:hypothetical protein